MPSGYNAGVEPERIGPYRLEGKLGMGGMGVVYLAFDERLQRRVAIKTIHPDRELSETRRQRLLREARSAARLSHPSIAQVYDILSEGGRDHIVMEYVEGQALSSVLLEAPLEIERAVSLARQVAEGLAAAHALGIVHRDLKPENILVTPRGGVKILDFGLAKNVDPGRDETSLTQDGVVMGTSRAMSPEQATGGRIDARSDLFSLGSLLYEMVTGRHPFVGSTPLDTMRRVVDHSPPPASRVNPAVPEELSLLIDSLLEKNPDHRPQSAQEVAAALEALEAIWTTRTTDSVSLSRVTWYARRRRRRKTLWMAAAAAALVLAAGAVAAWFWAHRPPPPLVAVVTRPAFGPGEPGERDRVALAVLRSAAADALAGFRGVSVPSFRTVDVAGEDPRDAARVAAASDVIVTGLKRAGGTWLVTVERLDRGGTVRFTTSFPVPRDDLSMLANAVASHLARAFPDRAPREVTLAAEPEIYERYVELRQAYDRPPAGTTLEEILQRMEAFRQAHPRFFPIYPTEARVCLYLYATTMEGRYLERARQLLDAAERLAPGDIRVAEARVLVELRSRDFEAAAGAVRALEELAPGSPEAMASRALLVATRDGAARALPLYERLVEIYPSAAYLWQLAEAQMHGGRVAEARKSLERALDLAPGWVAARSKLAQLELLSGDPARAEVLYEELARDSPDNGHFANLGTARLLQGKIREALDAYRRAHELAPGEPIAVLSMADCLELLGEEEEAEAQYRRALELADSVEDVAPSTAWSIRAQSLAHLGRAREAMAALQEEMRLAPDDPETYFCAALVHTIIGDRASAVVSAQKAVELGLSPRWLELPYFGPLRDDPDFAALLGGGSADPGGTGARAAPEITARDG